MCTPLYLDELNLPGDSQARRLPAPEENTDHETSADGPPRLRPYVRDARLQGLQMQVVLPRGHNQKSLEVTNKPLDSSTAAIATRVSDAGHVVRTPASNVAHLSHIQRITSPVLCPRTWDLWQWRHANRTVMSRDHYYGLNFKTRPC